MKDLDVFVKVGSTDHPAKINSMVRLSEEIGGYQVIDGKMGHQQQKI